MLWKLVPSATISSARMNGCHGLRPSASACSTWSPCSAPRSWCRSVSPDFRRPRRSSSAASERWCSSLVCRGTRSRVISGRALRSSRPVIASMGADKNMGLALAAIVAAGLSAVRDRLDRQSSRSPVDQPPHAAGRDRLDRGPDRSESGGGGGQERCRNWGYSLLTMLVILVIAATSQGFLGTHFDSSPASLWAGSSPAITGGLDPKSITSLQMRHVVSRSAAVHPSDLRDRADPVDGAGCPDPHRRKHRTRESITSKSSTRPGGAA